MTKHLSLVAALWLSACSTLPPAMTERFEDPNVHVVSEPYQPGAGEAFASAQPASTSDQHALKEAYFPATGGAIVEAVAGSERSEQVLPRPHIVRAGRLRENVDAILADYGWMSADFSSIPECAHWEVTADYTLLATDVADAIQRLLSGYPLVVDMHLPTRQARVSFAGRTPIHCEA